MLESQTTTKDDLGFALLKARRLERRAEKHLVQRRLKWIGIEKEYYNNMEHEAGQQLHIADVHVGFACAARCLMANMAERVKEYADSDSRDDSVLDSVSSHSDNSSDVPEI